MAQLKTVILPLLLYFLMLVDQGLFDRHLKWNHKDGRSIRSDPNKQPNGKIRTSCYRHREGTRRLNSRRIWIPNCDEKGFYSVKQCHGRYCWCADPHGKEIPGTKKITTKASISCEDLRSLSGPTKKTACLIEKEKTSSPSTQFRPLCRLDGSYFPVQCDNFSGYCWCVGEDGTEIDGSKTKRTPNCLSKGFGERPCYQYRKYIRLLRIERKMSVSSPSCKPDGYFNSKQCNTKENICWCVNSVGEEIAHTVSRSANHQCPNSMTNANSTLLSITTPCFSHKRGMARRNITGRVWDPKCDENGFYAAKQCLPNGECWCSDRYGKRDDETKQEGRNIVCGISSTPCLDERRSKLTQSLSKKLFIPQCLPNGYYTPVQCDTNEGTCWCADEYGNEISESKTKRTPNCFSNVLNMIGKGPCLLLKSHIDNLPNSATLIQPVCTSDGFFKSEQCTSVSVEDKYCWCVMPGGSEIINTISVGFSICHVGDRPAPAAPKVPGPCDDHIFHFNNIDTEHKDFVPDCDSKGFFSPLQCDLDRKFCWCVDRYGSTIEGTKVEGILSCDPDEEIIAPCHAFKKKLSDADPGYNPVCTLEGYFAPLQCNADKGNCWCVDKFGTGIEGTSIYGRPYCGFAKRVCEYNRRALLSSKDAQTEHVAPSCDLHGYYSNVQCNHTNGECWCADRNGNEYLGTRIKGIPECGQIPRPCDEHASRASDYDYIFGVFVPQCDLQGYYKTVQCHKQTNTCWYSNRLGAEQPGTKINGKPQRDV